MELTMWNGRLAPNQWRDQLGHAASRFWAAQTLAATVMRSSALNPTVQYSDGVSRAMERGADGIFEVGRLQFGVLAQAANELVTWIDSRGVKSFTILECPLGNSLPVQIVYDLAIRRSLAPTIFQWNAPRNDRPSRGQTIARSGEECASATIGSELVILLDDAITGTRFVKLFDALIDRVGRDRFLPIAMMFDDGFRPETREHVNRERLVKRVREQGQQLGYPNPVIQFPPRRQLRPAELVEGRPDASTRLRRAEQGTCTDGYP
jgi:hypothetical protein